MCTVGPHHFAGFLGRFHADFPGAELKLLEFVPDEIEKRLLAGEVDIAIMGNSRSDNDRFNSVTLYREGFAVACPIGRPFERKQGISLSDLDGENYLERVNCEYRYRLTDMCRELGFELHCVYSSDREDWVQTMVTAGLEIAILPEHIVITPGILTRPISDPSVAREVSLVTIRHRAFSPIVKQFIDAIRRYSWPDRPPCRVIRRPELPASPWWQRVFHIDQYH